MKPTQIFSSLVQWGAHSAARQDNVSHQPVSGGLPQGSDNPLGLINDGNKQAARACFQGLLDAGVDNSDHHNYKFAYYFLMADSDEHRSGSAVDTQTMKRVLSDGVHLYPGSAVAFSYMKSLAQNGDGWAATELFRIADLHCFDADIIQAYQLDNRELLSYMKKSSSTDSSIKSLVAHCCRVLSERIRFQEIYEFIDTLTVANLTDENYARLKSLTTVAPDAGLKVYDLYQAQVDGVGRVSQADVVEAVSASARFGMWAGPMPHLILSTLAKEDNWKPYLSKS